MASKGGQAGNNNAIKGVRARDALDLAIRNYGTDKEVASGVRCLVDIWNKMIEQAKDGNPQAANMIMDRLDGKPGQSMVLTGDEDNPVAITKIERVIVKATDTDC